MNGSIRKGQLKKENLAELVGIGMGIALALAGFLFATYTFAGEAGRPSASFFQDWAQWEATIPAISKTPIYSTAQAAQAAPTPSGGIPTPYKSKNTRVELADQETYALQGKIRIFRDSKKAVIYAFEVDLLSHPWIANYQRRISPYYPLQGDAATFSGLIDQTIVLTARAHGNIVYVGGSAGYLISLDPLAFGQP
ncbi:MAG: hypothetical protein JNL01_04165 [Bdellovibrionales bacterium]|nr:hypothetical protein [Bdellovibrionales bacterium]